MEEISFKEERIRKITNLYYSRPEIQKAIFEFSKNREICPRYFEGFGKRPDSFEYPGDIFELVKKGATSFNCSEELWKDPLKIETGMNEKQLNELRIGWDLVIDIDCKYIDFSKKATQAIVKVFKSHHIKNFGIKFSGNKGFHIILPWKAFPRELAGEKTKDLFPELPRKILAYIRFKAEEEMRSLISEEELASFRDTKIKRGIKCNTCKEIAQEYDLVEYVCPKCFRRETKKVFNNEKKELKCPDCRTIFKSTSTKIYECKKCNISSKIKPDNFSRHIEIDLFDLMGLDLILISPRHLFRMPYSLHESSALASIVLDEEELEKFDLKDANPFNIKVKDFMPDSKENEANILIREALDWAKQNQISFRGESKETLTGKYADFKPIKLESIKDEDFPPCVKNILQGVSDGKKRSLFVLINLFRSVGMDKLELEKRIYEWNKKNEVPLREGYVQTQLLWAYRKKPIMPPNCKEFYEGLAVCQPDGFCNLIKNPVNYLVRKNYISNNKSNKPIKSDKSEKKNQKKNKEAQENTKNTKDTNNIINN